MATKREDHLLADCDEEQLSSTLLHDQGGGVEEAHPKRSASETLSLILFAAGVVLGQVGQNVSLPLWVDGSTPSLDPYFVLFFASLFFTLLFGTGMIVDMLRGQFQMQDLKFPQWHFLLIGILDAANGIMVVFASPGTRTPPFLQSVLCNFTIPITIVLRFFLLRRVPSLVQLIAAGGVVGGLFLTLVPSIFKLDTGNAPPLAPGAWRILWPMIFMFGFVPAALMNVWEEKVMKMNNTGTQQGVRVMYFLFWSSFYQFLTLLIAGAAFDIIPNFGTADSLSQVKHNVRYGFTEFFVHFSTSGFRGFIFVSCYSISYFSTALLLRFSEGATWLAMVTSLVTPLGGVFWTVFREQPFGWDPCVTKSTYFSLAGLAVMCPCIFLYKTARENKAR